MTEAVSPAEPAGVDGGAARTAGALLKAAREREGLHLAVLAATIKVSPAKLQALEQDRYEQLPNATFTRALAQSVCRSLKIDPRPVLALLPQLESPPLEGAGARLNTPFHERPNRSDGAGLAWASKPMFWAGGLLLLAAVIVGLVPPSVIENLTAQVGIGARPEVETVSVALPASVAAVTTGVPAPPVDPGAASNTSTTAVVAPVDPAASVAAAGTAPAASVAAAAPSAAPVVAPAPVPVPVGSGLLRLSATADSWIEVLDAQGQAVFSRILARGEAVAVDAAPPLRVRVGNAAGTSVAFRGQSYDLAPYTRDNVARIELR